MAVGVAKNRFNDLLSELANEHNRVVDVLKRDLQEHVAIAGRGSSDELGVTFAPNSPWVSHKGSNSSRASKFSTSTLSTPQEATRRWNLDEREVDLISWRRGTKQFSKLSGIPANRLQRWLTWWCGLREPERSGCVARVLRSTWFNWIIALAILSNTVFLITFANEEMHAVLTGNTQHSYLGDRLNFEILFTALYSFETLLRIAVHRSYFCIGEGASWRMFDAILVMSNVSDLYLHFKAGDSHRHQRVDYLRAAHIMKGVRVLRLLRFASSTIELRLMMECALSSLRHLFWCLVMLVIVYHCIALIILQGMTSYAAENPRSENMNIVRTHFDTVGNTCISLFMTTAGGWDWREVYVIIGEAGVGYKLFFLLHISFFIIVIWNIVSSTFVEKAIRLGLPAAEAHAMINERASIQHAQELAEVLSKFNYHSGDGFISLEDFQLALRDERVELWFEARDVEILDAKMFFYMLTSAGETHKIPIGTLVAACMKLRGAASGLDLQTLHFEMHRRLSDNEKKLKNIERMLLLRQVPHTDKGGGADKGGSGPTYAHTDKGGGADKGGREQHVSGISL